MAVTLSLFAGAGAQFFDNNGVPLAGGLIYTYAAGTTTPAVTYTSYTGLSLHTNPILLDSAGRVSSGGEIWLLVGQAYKFIVKTSANVLVATYDNIPSAPQPPIVNDASSISYEQGNIVSAGAFVTGNSYMIATVGSTNFTAIGAINNVAGTVFIATGAGSGTGNAYSSRTVQNKFQETVSVKDFGAVGDGVADDTVAIQAALNAGDIIFFPYGEYLITSQLIAPPEVSLTGPVQTPSNRGTIQGPVLVSSATLGSTPMLVIRANAQVSNLAFRGVAKGTGVAIEARNVIDGTTGYVSTDVNITECGFTFFEYAVQHWNRGLKFERNDVQLCTYGVSLQWDEANFVDGASRIDGLPQGFRAIKVNDNRFHLIEICVLNSATDREYLRGFQCNSNLVDAGDVLFNGGLYTGEFVGNVVDLSSTTTGVIRLLSDVQSVDITGNLFAGESDMPDTDNPAAYLIRAGGAVNNINIVGNTLRYAGIYNIYLQGRIYGGSISNNSFYNDDTKTSACIAFDSRVSDLVISGNSFQNTTTHGIVFSDLLERSSITANTFYNIGTDAVSTDACVKTQSTFTDVTITANSFFPVTAPFGVRGITTEAFTRVIVDNNVFDTTKTLAAQYLETGTNYIQGEVVASPTQLTANVDNYAPSNASVWRLSSNASREISGLASTYVMVGRILTIINVGSNNIVIKNQGAGSNDANKIITGTGADITLAANQTAQLLYDFTTSRWRVI